MSYRLAFGLTFSAAVSLTIATAQAAAPEVGKALVVKNDVVLQSPSEAKPLKRGASVHQDESLITGKAASAEIELQDKTKLAVGPDSTIVLDKLVFDAAAGKSVTLNLSKGAFRFVTGLSPKETYEIRTPTATMGVRGTVFDVFVTPEGETAVLLHDGAVDVCPTPSTCQRHDRKGRVVHVSLARVLTSPLDWDTTIFKGLAFAAAFPFVGKRLIVDPVRRVAHTSLTRAPRTARRIVETPRRVIRRVVPRF